jgi:hypothetical protein
LAGCAQEPESIDSRGADHVMGPSGPSRRPAAWANRAASLPGVRIVRRLEEEHPADRYRRLQDSRRPASNRSGRWPPVRSSIAATERPSVD